MGSKQVAIITGAGKGMGECLLNSMKDKNWNIVAHAMSQDETVNFKSMDNVKWVYGDLSNEATIKNIYNCCFDTWKRCDCLVLNAAMVEPIMEIEKMDMTMLKKHFEVNFFSCMMLSKMCMKMLKDCKGKVICVTADSGREATQGCSPYCCSKAALNMLMCCMAKECPEMTCMAFDPMEMDTDMHQQMVNQGKDKMKEDFSKVSQSKVMDPMMPAKSLMNMMMFAPKDWSGMSMKWNDDKLMNMRK